MNQGPTGMGSVQIHGFHTDSAMSSATQAQQGGLQSQHSVSREPNRSRGRSKRVQLRGRGPNLAKSSLG